MKRRAVLVLLVLAGCGGSSPPSQRAAAPAEPAATAPCLTPRDGPGEFRETFSAISYEGQEGAPSYASILDLPEPGCWRLKLSTGELRASVDIQAVPPEALAEPCEPERVHYGPGGDVWVEGGRSGLRAHLGYWPERWRGLTRARVYTRGRAPDSVAAKVMWIFHAEAARDRGDSQLRLEGRNLQGPGTVSDEFAEVFYEGQNGKPSYASIVDLPRAGCWRLTVETGDLRGSIDIRAVDP